MESQSSTPRHVIGICTSASKSNIEAFINNVKSLSNVTVEFKELPYNDLDSFRLPSTGLDGVIICHSINNRRFAITDVMDALYDKFLPHVKQVFGKDNVCVIAHDFPWPMGSGCDGHARVKGTYMNNFRGKQFTTFECSKLAIICGRLDKVVEMDQEDCKNLDNFVHQCTKPKSYISIPVSIPLDWSSGENHGRFGRLGRFKKLTAASLLVIAITGIGYLRWYEVDFFIKNIHHNTRPSMLTVLYSNSFELKLVNCICFLNVNDFFFNMLVCRCMRLGV